MPNNLEEFVAWHDKFKPQISSVNELLRKSLSDEPQLLIKQMTELEAYNARVGFLLADADGFLDRQSEISRPPKEWGSEADRKASLEAAVSPVRTVRDKLEYLQDAIKQRLILGESILRYCSIFKDHGNHE